MRAERPAYASHPQVGHEKGVEVEDDMVGGERCEVRVGSVTRHETRLGELKRQGAGAVAMNRRTMTSSAAGKAAASDSDSDTDGSVIVLQVSAGVVHSIGN